MHIRLKREDGNKRIPCTYYFNDNISSMNNAEK